jgi:hypothetical protein
MGGIVAWPLRIQTTKFEEAEPSNMAYRGRDRGLGDEFKSIGLSRKKIDGAFAFAYLQLTPRCRLP